VVVPTAALNNPRARNNAERLFFIRVLMFLFKTSTGKHQGIDVSGIT
jgi:hypothetical protein